MKLLSKHVKSKPFNLFEESIPGIPNSLLLKLKISPDVLKYLLEKRDASKKKGKKSSTAEIKERKSLTLSVEALKKERAKLQEEIRELKTVIKELRQTVDTLESFN